MACSTWCALSLPLIFILLTSCLQMQLGREADAPQSVGTLRRGLQQASARWEAQHSKCTKVHLAGDPPAPVFTTTHWKAHHHAETTARGHGGDAHHRKAMKDDPLCARSPCYAHSSCFLGACVCHPGWHGESCDRRLEIANPW